MPSLSYCLQLKGCFCFPSASRKYTLSKEEGGGATQGIPGDPWAVKLKCFYNSWSTKNHYSCDLSLTKQRFDFRNPSSDWKSLWVTFDRWAFFFFASIFTVFVSKGCSKNKRKEQKTKPKLYPGDRHRQARWERLEGWLEYWALWK